jgi:hypothetical protein
LLYHESDLRVEEHYPGGVGAAVFRIRLIWIVRVRIIRIRIVGIIGIWIREPETDWESEACEHRIGPEKTVIGEESIIGEETTINEKAIMGEKVAVKIIESTVEKSTAPSKARTLKLVESATVKTHTTSLKTSRTTAMKAGTAKTPATRTDRCQRK